MKILFYDTETTGLVDHKAPHTAGHQPRLVQLAALLEEDGVVIGSLSAIIRPAKGVTIDAGAAAVHGITTERALARGVRLGSVLDIFHNWTCQADLQVGHNIVFDAKVMAGELHRDGLTLPAAQLVGQLPQYCTMRAATEICRLPGPRGFKWPKLSEAYYFAFAEPLVQAHDALADLRATRRLYGWLQGGAATPKDPIPPLARHP